MANGQIIIRRARAKDTRIQNRIIWDNSISTMARFSLIAMLSLPDTWDYSVRGMAVMLNVSKDTMGKYLKELETAGYLKRQQNKCEAGRFSSTQYILTDTPGDFGEEEPCPNFYDTEGETTSPCPNLPDPEKPDPKKSPQKKRTKEKNDTEQYPPKAPQGAAVSERPKRRRKPKAVPTWQPEKFEGFWSAYPRDEDRAKAVEQWDRLPQDKDLMARYGGSEEQLLRDMSMGLRRHLESRLWQDGVGIPYAFRWLRDRKWTEKKKRPAESTQPPSALPVPAGPRRSHTEIINGEEVIVYDE